MWETLTMATYQALQIDPVVQSSQAFLEALFGSGGLRDFAVRFWDAGVWEPDPGQSARFTLVLNHPGALRAMFWPPTDLTVGEAYIYDDFDIEGEVEAVFELADRVLAQSWDLRKQIRLM